MPNIIENYDVDGMIFDDYYYDAVGLSIGKIADMYETSDSNVTYRLRKFNIKKNAKLISSIKSDMIAKLYDLLLNHMSHEDIEKELRVDIRALILCDLVN